MGEKLCDSGRRKCWRKKMVKMVIGNNNGAEVCNDKRPSSKLDTSVIYD
jgi:hypothetical protein